MISTIIIFTRDPVDACDVDTTILGYRPIEGVNFFLAIAFALCALATLVIGIWKRTWSFSIAVGVGCALECVGYGARVPLHSNPCNTAAFQTQLVAIIIGPTIICVGLYLTLKHVALALNPMLSRISPRYLPFIFVPADVSCLVVQAVGGIIAVRASGDTGVIDRKMLDIGDKIIIAGICLQAIVLGGFGLAAGDYFLKCRRWIKRGGAGEETTAHWNNRKFKMFLYALVGAYIFIMIRCVYRIAEMAEGWGNDIMQDEPSFIALESFMILVASILLSTFPPGIFFPNMVTPNRLNRFRLSSSRKPEASENESGDHTAEDDFRPGTEERYSLQELRGGHSMQTDERTRMHTSNSK